MTAVILIAVAFGVTQAEGEREVTRAYLDVIVSITRDEAALAAGFRDLVEGIEDYNRARLVQALDELEDVGGNSLDRLLEAEPPLSLAGAHEALKIAVSRWRSGLSEVRAGLMGLSANPIDEEALAAVERARIDLLVGDSAYRGFLSEMTGVDTEPHGGPLPSIAFVPPGSEKLMDPQALARRILISPDIGVVVDLAVADLRLEPSPLGVQGGLPVVPPVGELAAEATIANRGNIDQLSVTVTLQLVSATGALHEDVVVISELKAGQMTTVRFAPLPVSPGTTYEVTIRVPEGDGVPENDRQSITFIVNPDD